MCIRKTGGGLYEDTFRDQVYPERQLLYLSTLESLVVKHGRDAARPVFSAPPTLCFHKSRPGGVPSRMGRCSCTHCHAPCTRARNSSFFTSASFSSFSNPVSSGLFLLSSSRLRPFSFKCFFMWFRRFLSTCIFFPPVSPNGVSPHRSPLQRAPLLLGFPA